MCWYHSRQGDRIGTVIKKGIMEAGSVPLAHLSVSALDTEDAMHSVLGLTNTLDWIGHLIH